MQYRSWQHHDPDLPNGALQGSFMRKRMRATKGRRSLTKGNGFEPSVPRRERNDSRSGTGTVTEATKVHLEAVAYLPGTDGSNPGPSSGESTSRAILPSHGEKPAFRAGVRARQVQRGQQRRVSHDAWRDRREYLCRAQFQYRGVDEAVA